MSKGKESNDGLARRGGSLINTRCRIGPVKDRDWIVHLGDIKMTMSRMGENGKGRSNTREMGMSIFFPSYVEPPC